jgi:predicted membrane-bound mannosyltransferase
MSDLPTTSPQQRLPRITWEHVFWVVIILLSILTRLWALGDRALHHDETLHAEYSYSLFAGLGFVHDPLLHGPFLYIMGAVAYFFFGDNDTTARLSPAIFSIALGLTPLLLRRELGRSGTVIAALMLLCSPVFLYIGRFFRHDIYAVVYEVLVLIAIIRYAHQHNPRWIFIGMVAMSLMLTTLETAYLYLAIFLPVIVAVFFWQVWKPGLAVVAATGMLIVASVFVLPGQARPADLPSEDVTVSRVDGQYTCPSSPLDAYRDNPIITAQPGPLFGWGALETVDNSYALCVRHQPDNDIGAYLYKLWQFFRHPAILTALVGLIAGVASLWYLVWRRRGADGQTIWEQASASTNPIVAIYRSLAVDGRIPRAIGLALIPYTLFFSSFLANPVGIISGTTGSLLYWLAQHEVKRGGQPDHYYAVMLAIYAPFIVCAGIASLILVGIRSVRMIRTGALPSRQLAVGMLLAWWSLGAFFIFSWAGEKMPWLTIHPLTPLTFLAAWGLGQLIDAWIDNHRHQPEGRTGVLTVAGMAGIVAFVATILMMMAINPQGSYAAVTPWIPVAFIIICTALAVVHIPSHGRLWSLGLLVCVLSTPLALYEIRSAWRLSFINGDIPKEMMIYTQTSPDAVRVVRDLSEASLRRSGDLSMPMWHDNETIWDWYFRRFNNGIEQPPGPPAVPGDEVMAIVILDENLRYVDESTLPGFLIQRYPLRWWFPEDQIYRLSENWLEQPVDASDPLLARVLRQPFETETAVATWRYLLYRDPGFPLGSSDFYVAVRPEIAPFMSLGLGAR